MEPSNQETWPGEPLGHYESHPLVQGGQGRTGTEARNDAWITFQTVLFMLVFAGFVTLALNFTLLTVGVAVCGLVLTIAAAIHTTPVNSDAPEPGGRIDTTG